MAEEYLLYVFGANDVMSLVKWNNDSVQVRVTFIGFLKILSVESEIV